MLVSPFFYAHPTIRYRWSIKAAMQLLELGNYRDKMAARFGELVSWKVIPW